MMLRIGCGCSAFLVSIILAFLCMLAVFANKGIEAILAGLFALAAFGAGMLTVSK